MAVFTMVYMAPRRIDVLSGFLVPGDILQSTGQKVQAVKYMKDAGGAQYVLVVLDLDEQDSSPSTRIFTPDTRVFIIREPMKRS